MKKALVLLFIVAGLSACEKRTGEFPDFDYTTGYFPYQYPVRTLVLGDYIYDNSNDNNHKFIISAAMGGVYSNSQDRVFDIQVDSSLCKNALFGSGGDTIRMMPSSYYSLSSTSKLIIPAGHVNGGIEVQLTDAFFDDPTAIKLGYVIPIRIVNASNLDSVLRGQTTKAGADPRIGSLWDIQPKDFTMFAVNFINEFHGTYLHRGVSIVKDEASNVLERNIYNTPYIVDNELWNLTTTGRRQVEIQGSTHSLLMADPLKMKLTFSDNDNCTVTESDGSYQITGTGKFVKDGDEWGGKKRNVIYLNYEFTSAGNTYSAADTLVIRDREIKMQLYDPIVY